ncbi:hypothetical protein LQ772_06860 [Frateuria edaphi]|uniref:Gp138 family membrane-puncturing spike protein n=1 Tax=Frateuria edaphi TaxID=2898793 RepID=UPI001E2EBB9D|nr:Gp138 family membrane-puncturing spike protein [Frateuria edaphi]UGB47006.1 hypothetical protein LQ772_06860 [Frateuria edaphi]
MNNEQRFDDPQTTMRRAVRRFLANLWTAMPGYIVDFDAATCTATVQLGVQAVVSQPDGSTSNQNITVLPRVPVVFPRGGGCSLTFPVQPGDECLVVFAARSCGAWKQSGGSQVQSAPGRLHSLSDGFALLGTSSQPNVIQNLSTSTTQLRSDDGSTYVELDAAGQVLNFVAPGGCHFTTPEATFSGKVTASQDIASTGGDVKAGTVSLKNHLTTNVTAGSGLSGKPQQ